MVMTHKVDFFGIENELNNVEFGVKLPEMQIGHGIKFPSWKDYNKKPSVVYSGMTEARRAESAQSFRVFFY